MGDVSELLFPSPTEVFPGPELGTEAQQQEVTPKTRQRKKAATKSLLTMLMEVYQRPCDGSAIGPSLASFTSELASHAPYPERTSSAVSQMWYIVTLLWPLSLVVVVLLVLVILYYKGIIGAMEMVMVLLLFVVILVALVLLATVALSSSVSRSVEAAWLDLNDGLVATAPHFKTAVESGLNRYLA